MNEPDHTQGTAEPTRRGFLRSTVGVSLGLLALGSSHVGHSTGIATANTQEGVVFEHSTLKLRKFKENVSASYIRVLAENVTVSREQDRVFRIVDDRDQSVRIVPQEAGDIELGEVAFDIYEVDGTLRDEPTITVFDAEYPVEVLGDTSMFESDPIFSGYTVELIESGEILAATEERIYGVGFYLDLAQDSTWGDIEVSFPVHDEVREAWAIEFSAVTYDGEGRIAQEITSEFRRDGDRYVTEFDATALVDVPDGGFRNFDVNFYVDGDPETGVPNLWAADELVVGEEETLPGEDGDGEGGDGEGGDGEDGADDDSGTNETGDGDTGSDDGAADGSDDDGALSWLWVIAGGLGLLYFGRRSDT